MADEFPEHQPTFAAELATFDFRLASFGALARLPLPYDINDAFVRVATRGEPGTPPWGQQLLRFYQRWAERMGFACEWIDGHPDSHTDDHGDGLLRIAGPFAFGMLRRESGMHWLVRVTQEEREYHAAVDVLPDGEPGKFVEEELSRQTFRLGQFNPYN